MTSADKPHVYRNKIDGVGWVWCCEFIGGFGFSETSPIEAYNNATGHRS